MEVKVNIKEVNRQIEKLIERKQNVTSAEIPEILRDSFFKYMFGKTVQKKDNTIFYYYADFIRWVRKIYG
ncbi:MAG: hypothetical protein WD555_01690 [Fulvivirga sp.]